MFGGTPCIFCNLIKVMTNDDAQSFVKREIRCELKLDMAHIGDDTHWR